MAVAAGSRFPTRSAGASASRIPPPATSSGLRFSRATAAARGVLTRGKGYYTRGLAGGVFPPPAGGLVHDGCVRAMDVGPAIIGRHIDFFVGYYSAYTNLINGSTT